MSIVVFHNPRCAKSRATLKLLAARGLTPQVVEYLKTPPTAAELDDILQRLKLDPRELMRKNESEYRSAGLDSLRLSRAELINAIIKYPKLIERPIVLKGRKAAIGRPPEAVLKIL